MNATNITSCTVTSLSGEVFCTLVAVSKDGVPDVMDFRNALSKIYPQFDMSLKEWFIFSEPGIVIEWTSTHEPQFVNDEGAMFWVEKIDPLESN